MKKVFQNKFSSEDGTEHGNCLEACCGSIVECAIEDVTPMREGNGVWFSDMENFLERYGYECLGTRYAEDENLIEASKKYEKEKDGNWVIMCGDSPREYVTNGHAVLYRNGELIHDPHPSNDGLKSLKYFLMITKIKPITSTQ